MAFLSRVSNYLWSYVQPRKTQQKREKPFKATAAGAHAAVSTPARVQQWRERHNRLSPPTTESYASNIFETASHQDQPHQSIERTPPSSDRLTPSNAVDDFDANETTLVMTEHDYANERLEHNETFDAEAERERLERLKDDLSDKGWAGDAIALFTKLEARGKEPLLPKSWELEFETLPEALFTPEGFHPYIASLTEAGDFRASLALKELIKLAPRVRDADFSAKQDSHKKHKSPEAVTKKAVAEYIKWAYADAKLNVASPNSRKSLDSALAAGKSLPLLINEAGPRTMSGAELQASALDKLVKLGEQWKASLLEPATGEYITELPTLYAVISTYTVFGFVAYDIDFVRDDGELEEPFLRTIAVFDFSQKGYDVWNSLAVALLGIHVRNEMVDIRKDIQAVKGMDFGVIAKDVEDE